MMSNPIYNALGGATQNGLGNMGSLIRQFNQFKSMFKGDPKQQVQQLLNSGKVSQEDYNRAVQMANQLQSLLK